MADVNYAIRWVKAHASEFNGDPARFGTIGSSSGGHQGVLNALRPGDPRYAAVPLDNGVDADATVKCAIGCWPIVDPFARYLFAQDTGREELIARTEAYFGTQDAMQEGNPQMILDRGEPVELPPLLILQGTADTNVTPEIQERFAASYRARGGDCELHIFEGMPHGTTQWPEAEAGRALERIKTFLDRTLS
jgi:acetyl esterase/lipase